MENNKITLKISEDDNQVGYIYLPKHSRKEKGIVKKSISIDQLISDYKGIPLIFDFDKDNELIGIEILG